MAIHGKSVSPLLVCTVITCAGGLSWLSHATGGYANIDIGAHLLQAMLFLYLMLAAASLGVGLYSVHDSSLRKQVNAWWLIFPIVSLSLLLYPLGLPLLALAIALLALRELALHHCGPLWQFVVPCLVLLLWQATYGFTWLPALLLVQALHFFLRRQRNQLLLLLFLLLCCGLSFMLDLMRLPFSPEIGRAWLFYLFVVTALNDIGQFISGKCLGKHAIAPRISPNKTWQGLAGGILLSMLVSVVLGSFLELAGVSKLLGLALLLSVGGFLGDLMFSAAKRYLGIKDFSQLIPGHGGILDRVDSLMLTAPLLYAVLSF